MERQTKGVHSEFDLAGAVKAYAKVKEELEGEQITSPFDLYSVERLRDEHGLRQGVAFATDVFVLGFGTAPDRRQTKVSGLPYWPRSKAWPVAEDGLPCQFLAQFCFLDSRDLVGKLPGDILLLFVPQNNEEWPYETDLMHLEWLTVGKEPLIEGLPQGVKPYCASQWYGVRHRTHDYPEAVDQADELELGQSYNLPILNATKIGGVPHGIQSQIDYVADPATGLPVEHSKRKKGRRPQRQFLCQLTSIQAAPDVPYPWTNQKKKLSLEFDSTGIYGEENCCVFGDMGSLYVFMEPTGKCTVSTESY